MSELKRISPIAAVALALGFLTTSSMDVRAADFQVAVKRFSVPQCSLTGSMLNIDPTSGSVSIDLSADFSCYPLVVSSIANGASLSVTGASTVGGGTTGEGTINLQLNTGLSTITPGVTCVPDGFTASNVSVSNGWATNLCSSNCGATVTRSVDVQNTSPTSDGSITFKAKCTYQDQSNANLSSVRTNIQSVPSVTVLHGSAPTANYCQSVSELANPKGLTPAMRQQTAKIVGGNLAGNAIDLLNYVSVFGVSANTYPAGSSDTLGFGFPGTNRSTIQTSITRDKYWALQFRSPTNTIWLNRVGNFFPESQASVSLSMAIAPCPGQFDDDANYPLTGMSCKADSLFEASWIIGSTTNICKVVPGKTYYLNIIQAGRNTPTDSYCPSASCTMRLTSNHASWP